MQHHSEAMGAPKVFARAKSTGISRWPISASQVQHITYWDDLQPVGTIPCHMPWQGILVDLELREIRTHLQVVHEVCDREPASDNYDGE